MDISGVVAGTKELSDSVLKAAGVSATVGPNLVVARVVVFSMVVGLDPSWLVLGAVKVTVPPVTVLENSGSPTEVAGGEVCAPQEATV